MDSRSSSIHGYAANSNDGGGNSGFMRDAASGIPSVLQCREQQLQHEVLLDSQIQQHLNQISMHMNMDEIFDPAAYGNSVPSGDISSVLDDFESLPTSHHAAGGYSLPFSPSTFSSLGSACSPGMSSTVAHVLAAPAISSFPEVSSQVNFHDTPAEMAPGVMSRRASSFRRYERHLCPRPRLTKPACGQRMFKTSMLFLHKMHTAIQQQQQQYHYQQQQQQQREASAAEQSENQLQHTISERKRRDRLNEGFQALRTVLPPGSKKDRTSTLIVAREYVNSLKSKVRELEEKNQALQTELDRREDEADERAGGAKVEIQITAAAEGDQTGDVCTVNIATPAPGGNTTNVVLRTLQCLKERVGEDVSLVSMSTCDNGDRPPHRRHRTSLTLLLKSASGAKWEEKAVREAVTKAMASLVPAGGPGGAE